MFSTRCVKYVTQIILKEHFLSLENVKVKLKFGK